MGRVKHILTVFLVGTVFLTTSGFALHTIQCQMTGDTYYSVVEKICCCEASGEKTKCCDEESLVIKVDSQAALKALKFDVNEVFVGAFFTYFVELVYPAANKANYLSYSRNSPPLPEQEIIILVQSFLL